MVVFELQKKTIVNLSPHNLTKCWSLFKTTVLREYQGGGGYNFSERSRVLISDYCLLITIFLKIYITIIMSSAITTTLMGVENFIWIQCDFCFSWNKQLECIIIWWLWFKESIFVHYTTQIAWFDKNYALKTL